GSAHPGSAVLPVPAAGPFVQAGGQGAPGGQVVFQGQDAQRGGQGAALAGQLPDRDGEGELAAAAAAAPAGRPPRPPPARSPPARRNACRTPSTAGSAPGGAGRVVRVIQVIEPSGHRRIPGYLQGPGAAGQTSKLLLDSFLQSTSCSPRSTTGSAGIRVK